MYRLASIVVGSVAAFIFISMFVVRIARGYNDEYKES